MALGANLHADLRLGRTGLDGLAAGAADDRRTILGMNSLFHDFHLFQNYADVIGHRPNGNVTVVVYHSPAKFASPFYGCSRSTVTGQWVNLRPLCQGVLKGMVNGDKIKAENAARLYRAQRTWPVHF